ncbi:MAG: hypothetical protein AB1467_02510 [Candidatus Diapherotrites archaeon]
MNQRIEMHKTKYYTIKPKNFFREAEKRILRLEKRYTSRSRPLDIEKAWMNPKIGQRIYAHFERRFFAGVPERKLLIGLLGNYASARIENKRKIIKNCIIKLSETKRIPLGKAAGELIRLFNLIEKKRHEYDSFHKNLEVKGTKPLIEPSLGDSYAHWSFGLFARNGLILIELKKELARIKFNEEFSRRRSSS